MTETNKLRAVFLAALMFLAVFAGTVALAGSAAATHAGDSGEMDPSQTTITEADRTINVSDTEEGQQVNLHVYVNNTETEYFEIDFSESRNNGINVTSASGGAGTGYNAEIENIDYEANVVNVSVTALDATTTDFDGDASVTLQLDTSETDLTDKRVRHVASDKYGNTDNLDYRAIEQGTTTHVEGVGAVEAWEGETLTTYGDSVDQIITVETLGSKGATPGHARNWDTSGMDAGDYNITYASTEYENQLTVKPLNLSVAADDVHADENVTAQVATEDLNGNEVTVRLIDSNDDVVANVTDNLDGDGNLEADLGQQDEGSYTVHVTHGPSTVTATTSVDVGEAPESVVDFEDSVISQNQGDVAVVTLNATEEFELVVGNEDEMGYEATMTVTPNEDGKAVIAMNTYQAGAWGDAQEGDAYEGLEGTSVSGVSETQLNDALDQGLYDLIARNPVDANDEHDIAALNVEDRSTDGVSVYTAPQGKWSAASSAASIREAQENDVVTEDAEIAENDHLVLEIEASGIYGALEGEDAKQYLGPNQEGLNLTLTQTNPGPNKQPMTIDVSGDADNRVFVDADNKTVWVALDGRSLEGDREIKAGHNFNATFEVDENYAYVDSEEDAESVSDDFTLVERTGELDVDSEDFVTVQADSGQEISGVTSVAPGTELTLRARATGESPFLKSQSATVHDHGDGPAFHAEFDFSNINVGQEFTASVTGGNFDASAPGRVAESDYATVSVSDQEAVESGDVVSVDRVYLPEGGFVTVHDDSLLDGATFDSVRGTSDYLSEGEHQDVEVELDEPYDLGDHEVIPMAHQDTNDNQEYDFVDSEGEEDGAYFDADGEAVTDSATLSVVEEDPETPTPTDTPADDDGEDDDSTEEPTDSPTDTDDQPGFGAVVALIALLGAALLAARRNAF